MEVIESGLFNIFTLYVPIIFFLGILSRVAERANDQNGKLLTTEPIVLTGLGVLFLFTNGEYLRVLNSSLSYRLSDILTIAGASTTERSFFYLVFTMASVGILATLAKAFWTHVLLEEGHWGPISDYRDSFWNNTQSLLGLGGIELLLRCSIAVFVVLLQSQLSLLSNVEFVDLVSAGTALDQAQEPAFFASFSYWLAWYSFLGFCLYSLILVWLGVVSFKLKKTPKFGRAFLGTATSTVPSLTIVWLIYFLATGSVLPFPISEGQIGQPSSFAIISLTALFCIVAIFVIGNVMWTLIFGPLKQIVRQLKGY